MKSIRSFRFARLGLGVCAQVLVVASIAACAHGDDDTLDAMDNPSTPDDATDASMSDATTADEPTPTADGGSPIADSAGGTQDSTAAGDAAGMLDGSSLPDGPSLLDGPSLPDGANLFDGAADSPNEAGGLPASITDGLVLYLPFDNGLAVDATGMHSPALFSTTNLASAPDRFGNPTGAALFAASPPSLVQVGTPNLMPLGSAPRTLAIWVRPRISAPPSTSSRPNSNVFVHWGIDNCTSKMFGIGTPGNVAFGWTGCDDITSNFPVPPSVWTFTAVVYDGSTMTLVAGQQQTTLTGLTLATTTSPLAVGGERDTYSAGFTYYFDGDLDDLRVWNRALTPSELTALALDY